MLHYQGATFGLTNVRFSRVTKPPSSVPVNVTRAQPVALSQSSIVRSLLEREKPSQHSVTSNTSGCGNFPKRCRWIARQVSAMESVC